MSTEMKMRAERDGPPMSELVKCHCGSGRHRAWSAPHCLTCERTCSDRSRYIEVPDELTDLEAMSLVLSAGLGLSEDEIAIGFSWLPVPKHQPGRQFWNIWASMQTGHARCRLPRHPRTRRLGPLVSDARAATARAADRTEEASGLKAGREQQHTR